MIHIPKESNCKASNATIGVKFCQDTFLLKSFLDQKNIDYNMDELEKTPFGLALRIKKEG